MLLRVILLSLLLMDPVTAHSFKMTSLKCESPDEKWAEIVYCRIKAVNRNITETSIRINLHRLPVTEAWVHVIIGRRGFGHIPIINITIDACNFMKTKRRNLAANTLYNLMGFEKYTNANHTCPYDHDVMMERYKFDDDKIAYIPVPAGIYKLQSMWSNNKTLRFSISFNFEIS